MTQVTVPAHVPRELVVDYDIFNMPKETGRDPQQTWRVFKGRGPLVYSPYNYGHWIATSGADVFKFFRDPTHFSSEQVAIPAPPPGDIMLPIQADPPFHGKHRVNIQSLFTPDAIEAFDPKIRTLTVDLIEGFRSKGTCEFVSEFALQLPLVIFLRMMALPLDDRLYLRDLIETFSHSPSVEEKAGAHQAVHEYLEKWIDKRIANPGDDAISHITRATFDGRPYTKAEMVSTLTLLLHAGLDTVAMMLGFIAFHLARSPKDRAYVRNNPDKMNAIVQELLRRYAGPNLGRTVAMDYTYKGVTMKKGDRIFLIPSLFNMDEETLSNPDEVDFDREARHITFGAGPHTCAGALLARREITIFLDEWLNRIPEFEIDPTRPLKMVAAPQNSVFELWLRWPVAS